MSERKWIIKDETINRGTISALMEELGCGELLASALSVRGIKSSKDAEKFLTVNDLWNDPMALPDMAKALNRVKRAKSAGEVTAVFGDYDADGITATTIMKDCLEKYGITVIKYIPDRNTEGYGMNKEAIDKLHSRGVGLIITVDCGVSCAEEIKYAKGMGIDVIVTDHHNCPEVLPECIAVINPKRKDSLYPCTHLAGAGVAYKFACALVGIDEADRYLQAAAIGTIADVVELTGENRKIVTKGIEMMNSNPVTGVEAILMSAGKNEVDSSAIAYIIAPRINCAGRMESPDSAFELIASEEINEALKLADKLNTLNRERQKCEQEIYTEAVEIIKNRMLYNDKVIVVGKRNWNPGVIGIAAAKITEKINKPCILIAYDSNGIGRASGRSIEDFNLYDAIKSAESLLIKFGGHALAAGLSVEEKNEEHFRMAINEYAELHFTKEMEIRKVYVDSIVRSEAITVGNIEELTKLEPFGTGNEKPVFAFVNSKIYDLRELSEGKHLKLTLKKDDFLLEAIAFGYGAMAKKLYKGMTVHVAGNLEINDYNGKAQMIVKDILY